MIGFPVSFWEPARLVDITRTPYCMIGLGGVAMGGSGVKGRGDVALDLSNDTMHSFYQVHWYIYPVIYWFELLTDFMCLEKSEFDVGYLTELDPFWNDDELSALLNPEAILFGNPIAQAACAADCIAATTHLPFAPLIWCAGCLGSVYPFTGTVTSHNGGVQVSSLLAIRMMAKLHRELVLHGYIGVKGLCGKYPMPVIQKQQYRLQMTYPIPSTGNARKSCHALGHTDVTWNMGREFPYKGEDFGYLVWRKRDCCL
jgi:conjugal transfer pilus assembly protein TraU